MTAAHRDLWLAHSALANRAYVASDGRGMVTNLRRAAEYFGVDSGAWRGELLEVAREAWGDPNIHVAGDGITWQPVNGNLDDIDVGYQDDEAEALVALLEAAP